MYIELTKKQFFVFLEILIAKTDDLIKVVIAQDFMSYTDSRFDITYQYIESDKSQLWDCALELLSQKYNGRITLI